LTPQSSIGTEQQFVAPDQQTTKTPSLAEEIRTGSRLAETRQPHAQTTLDTPHQPSAADTLHLKLPYLQSIFKQMLIDRELPLTVTLQADQQTLVVEGVLAQNKQAILSRMLKRFQLEQVPDTQINNQVKAAKTSLPFEIVQVTSGPYGNVVTDSGERLFVGDQLGGFQLVAIQDRHLVFAGKSRITVAW
ncbi:MAG: hypothetical protein R3183_11300, partial [Oleiphilaceae bacterium]|nr:hypothetical protein [Oleiphilaceae bacterium]